MLNLDKNRLPPADRDAIVRRIARDCSTYCPPMAPDDVEAATQLALDLYAAAAAHGLGRADADAVTSFISAAIDGIRARARIRTTRNHPN
jgi:hypothetical protein